MAAAAQVAAATNVDVTSMPGMFLCLVVGGVVVGAGYAAFKTMFGRDE